jgi:hypothetical protein
MTYAITGMLHLLPDALPGFPRSSSPGMRTAYRWREVGLRAVREHAPAPIHPRLEVVCLLEALVLSEKKLMEFGHDPTAMQPP